MNSSKIYKITIVFACTFITVTPLFAHHQVSMWTSVNNHISCRPYHLSRVSSATYHQHCRFNGSTTFKRMSYERSIGEIQCHRSRPYIYTPPDCYVTKKCTTIFRVSSIPCIGCNRSNMCHLATVTCTTTWRVG